MPPSLFAAVPLWEWWPLLPLAAGAAAVYLLLPRPRAYPVLWGALLGLVALVLAGVLLARVAAVTPETVLFYAFSAIALVAGTLLVTQRNPAHAALSFALVVLATCGLFLLLAAPFLMAATIIIYAGAIIVTFLFILMLAQQEGPSDADARSREPLLASITGFVLLGTLLFVLGRYQSRIDDETGPINELLARTRQAQALDSRDEIIAAVGKASAPDELFKQFEQVLDKNGQKDLSRQVEDLARSWSELPPPSADVKVLKTHLAALESAGEDARARLAWLPPANERNVPLSDLSGPPPTLKYQDRRRGDDGRPRVPAENSAYLGRALFTDFLLPVELGGTLLLVATVGAIAIAHRRS